MLIIYLVVMHTQDVSKLRAIVVEILVRSRGVHLY